MAARGTASDFSGRSGVCPPSPGRARRADSPRDRAAAQRLERVLHAASGVDLDAVLGGAAADLGNAFEEEGPHVELQLTGDAKPVVKKVEDAIAAPCPRLDLEDELAVLGVARPELDLPGLHVAAQRREAEGATAHVRNPHGPVPSSRQPDPQLVTGLDRAGLLTLESRDLERAGDVRVIDHDRHELVRVQKRPSDLDAVPAVKGWPVPARGPLDLGRVSNGAVAVGKALDGPRAGRVLSADVDGARHVAPRGERHADQPTDGTFSGAEGWRCYGHDDCGSASAGASSGPLDGRWARHWRSFASSAGRPRWRRSTRRTGVPACGATTRTRRAARVRRAWAGRCTGCTARRSRRRSSAPGASWRSSPQTRTSLPRPRCCGSRRPAATPGALNRAMSCSFAWRGRGTLP